MYTGDDRQKPAAEGRWKIISVLHQELQHNLSDGRGQLIAGFEIITQVTRKLRMVERGCGCKDGAKIRDMESFLCHGSPQCLVVFCDELDDCPFHCLRMAW